MNEVKMPVLKPDAKTSVLCAWLKGKGDAVVPGEPLFEAETDKVVTQIEATCAGTVDELMFDEGDEVPVGAVVAKIK